MAVEVPDEGTDSVGMYFDSAEGLVNTTTAGLADQVMFYLVLAGVSRPTVAAWELALDFDPALGLILDAGLQDDEVNYASLPQFIVGLGSPRPPDEHGNFVLAAPTFFVQADAVIDFFAGPTTPSSLDPPLPDYVNGEDLQDIVPMNYSVDANGMHVDEDGWCMLVIASINGEGAVATEDATWTSVKNLYR
jgi:hypothetical protein